MPFTVNPNTSMRFILIVIGCLIALGAVAQVTEKQRYIKLTYVTEQVYSEEAVQTIESMSRVPAKASVSYKAGQSILLQPGFNADKGASFLAHIADVSDVKLQLAAFPNPFDQMTTIRFDLPETGTINLYIVDAQGKIIERLLENSQHTAGRHEFEWKASTLPTGVYTPILQTSKDRISSRLIKK